MYNIYTKTGMPPGGMRKLLLIMKLTTLLMITVILQVSASSFAQKISLKAKNEPLTKVFEQISSQTGFDFAYTTKTLEKAKPVNITVSDEDLSTVLKKIFDGQPLDYSIEDKSVVVSVKQVSFLDKVKEAIAATDVTGRVTDESNQPLSGATIKTKDNKVATSTDVNGFFTLKNVQPDATIVISFIGYDAQEKPAIANLGQIKLKTATSKLDEIQVQAYGVISKRLATGNIATINAKEIEQQPVSNPMLALQGRVAGLTVTQSSGISGGTVDVQIRGQNLINGTGDPLYVIDGVPYPAQMLATLFFTSFGVSKILGGNTNGSPFSFLNPNDIESISVLKDADATSIYGTRAANGAIVITTKKGKAGETRVNITLQNGVGDVAHFLPLMNTAQYLQMRHEALKNGNLKPRVSDYDINGGWDTTQNHNWQKELIGNTARYTDYNASVSGGADNIQYLVSSTYHRQTTVFPTTDADQKISTHFNIGAASTNQKFHISLTGSYLFDNNQLPQTDLTTAALTLAPDAPNLYNVDGTINWQYINGASSFGGNPVKSLFQSFTKKTNNLVSNLNLSYELISGLTFSSNFGYTSLTSQETQLSPYSAIPDNQKVFSLRQASFLNQDLHSWIIEPQLNYRVNLGKGRLSALLGSAINQQFSDGTRIDALGQNSDAVLLNLNAAPLTIVGSLPEAIYKYASIFGKVNYNWEDKYLLDFSARRDGSSRFGPSNRFANFWSTGAAWIFSEEKLIKENIGWLSFGKLRSSYGTTGSDQIGDYQYFNLFTATNANLYQGLISLTSSTGQLNPFLQWSVTKKFEVSGTLGFLKDRIMLEAAFFQNRSSNQLGGFPTPIITGVSAFTENLPIKTQEQGWEFLLNTVNIKGQNFSWTSSFNVSFVRNKLLAVTGFTSDAYKVNQPFSNYTPVYHYVGVDKATGLYQFSDGKGGVTTTPGNNYPESSSTYLGLVQYYGGFQNSFTYKDFSLDILFQFTKQRGPNLFGGIGNPPGTVNNNQPVWLLDRWKSPGDMATYEKYNSNRSLTQNLNDVRASDAAYGDASYIRLKNASFSWQLPKSWTNKAHFQNAKIFVNGQNLFTITNYLGLDPEVQGTSLPPLRVISFGVQATL